MMPLNHYDVTYLELESSGFLPLNEQLQEPCSSGLETPLSIKASINFSLSTLFSAISYSVINETMNFTNGSISSWTLAFSSAAI